MTPIQEMVWFYILRDWYWLDPKTGVLVKKETGKALGLLNTDGYVKIRFETKTVTAHRLIWLYLTGHWPKYTIDHRNGYSIDNRPHNLRDVPMRVHVPKASKIADKPCLRKKRRIYALIWEGMKREAENNWQRKIKKKNSLERDICATQEALPLEFIG